MTRAVGDWLRTRFRVIQAPMAGASDIELAIAVSAAGGVGSLPCAMLRPEEVREAVSAFRRRAAGPLNLNFFCHAPPAPDEARESAWRRVLAPYFSELNVSAATEHAQPERAAFDDAMCDVVEAVKPEIVSFHFGLPAMPLLARVKRIGAMVFSSATTVEEARWLEERGCDGVIAQGIEAGGHRGHFLSTDLSRQFGMLSLVTQVVHAVRLPVIAAGGIMDSGGVARAMAVGASAVQLGTAFLRTTQCATTRLHRQALASNQDRGTALTNLFTGRPARGILNRLMRELGPIRDDVPAFPRASYALAPLRAMAEARGADDFSPLWAGDNFGLAREDDAGTLTREFGQAAR
jgi:nitronate monooxygenase